MILSTFLSISYSNIDLVKSINDYLICKVVLKIENLINSDKLFVVLKINLCSFFLKSIFFLQWTIMPLL